MNPCQLMSSMCRRNPHGNDLRGPPLVGTFLHDLLAELLVSRSLVREDEGERVDVVGLRREVLEPKGYGYLANPGL